MIGIGLNKKEFEYDIAALVKAFFPQEQVKVLVEAAGSADSLAAAKLQLKIDYEADRVRISLRRGCQYSNSEAAEILAEEQITFADSARLARKNELKRAVYRILEEQTGHGLVWGTLTGIRPVKLAAAMLEEGLKNTQAAETLRNDYLVSREKTALCVAIANRELDLLGRIDYRNGYSIYIGIPFCPSICLYCSFSSFPLERYQGMVADYLTALFKEIEYVAAAFAGKKLNTVYIGGGTPTTLNESQLDQLLTKLGSHFDLAHLAEFTVEAGRPDSVTAGKLKVLKQHGVSRISVNPQTMKQETLDLIGRRHTVEDTIAAFLLARELGFDNINMDLIVGLPDEELADVRNTMEQLAGLNPDSITVHSLAVKRAARLNIEKDHYQDRHFTNNSDIMDLTGEYARAMEMFPYYLYRQKNMAGNLENVGYAKPEKACLYNILMMEERQSIIAMGAGASTKLLYRREDRSERIENVKDVQHYITRIDEMIGRKQQAFAEYFAENGDNPAAL